MWNKSQNIKNNDKLENSLPFFYFNFRKIYPIRWGSVTIFGSILIAY